MSAFTLLSAATASASRATPRATSASSSVAAAGRVKPCTSASANCQRVFLRGGSFSSPLTLSPHARLPLASQQRAAVVVAAYSSSSSGGKPEEGAAGEAASRSSDAQAWIDAWKDKDPDAWAAEAAAAEAAGAEASSMGGKLKAWWAKNGKIDRKAIASLGGAALLSCRALPCIQCDSPITTPALYYQLKLSSSRVAFIIP